MICVETDYTRALATQTLRAGSQAWLATPPRQRACPPLWAKTPGHATGALSAEGKAQEAALTCLAPMATSPPSSDSPHPAPSPAALAFNEVLPSSGGRAGGGQGAGHPAATALLPRCLPLGRVLWGFWGPLRPSCRRRPCRPCCGLGARPRRNVVCQGAHKGLLSRTCCHGARPAGRGRRAMPPLLLRPGCRCCCRRCRLRRGLPWRLPLLLLLLGGREEAQEDTGGGCRGRRMRVRPLALCAAAPAAAAAAAANLGP